MARRRTVPAALAVVLVGAVHVSSVAAPEWRSLTDGYGWPPCATVEFTIDADSLPSNVSQQQLRSDLQAAAQRVNAGVGRSLVAIASGTTAADPDASDGLNVVHFRELVAADDPSTVSVYGYAATSWRTYSDGSGEIVDADILLDRTDWGIAPPDLRIQTLTHEVVHALGLDHVGDAHEITSYGYLDDGAGLGPGTVQALQHLYAGSGCTPLRDLDDSHDWSGLRADGPSAQRLRAGESATDVRALAVEMGQRLGAGYGGGLWATHAVVCRADLYPDCLAGAPLAGSRAPLVYVPGGPGGTLSTSDPTYQFLQSAVPADAPVYVLGGPSAVSDAVLQTLRTRWPKAARIAGPGRIETAAEVARAVAKRSGATTAMVARADNPADAVTGGAAAAAKGLPIVLTWPTKLEPAASSALRDVGATRTLVLGGPSAVSDATFQQLVAEGRSPVRLAGRTRTETSVAIATHAESWNRTTVSEGSAFLGLNGYHDETWALALASAPLAAAANAPILLTEPSSVPYVPPAGGSAGDVGHYLSHLGGSGRVQMLFVGAGRWADPHARESFWEYLGLW